MEVTNPTRQAHTFSTLALAPIASPSDNEAWPNRTFKQESCVMTVDQQQESLPWRQPSSWRDMTEQMRETRPDLASEAARAAHALELIIPWESMRFLLDDIPFTWEVSLVLDKAPDHVERELGKISGAIRREIIARHDPERILRVKLFLSEDEAVFVAERVAIKGYSVNWEPAPEQLPAVSESADGRKHRTIVISLPQLHVDGISNK